MKNIVKNILKEEYNQKKLKDYVYGYIDKKIESGEWKFVENAFGDIELINLKGKYISLIYNKRHDDLRVFQDLYDKFGSTFSIGWDKLRWILIDYINDKFMVNADYAIYLPRYIPYE